MAWTVYKSTDSGAPVLTGQDESGLDLLDAILTGPSGDGTGNAYGSTPCAGWVRVMSESYKRVYRPGPGARARQYFRVWQPTGDSQGYVNGYTSMSDIDTGRDPFPCGTPPSQVAFPYALLPNSTTLDATPRPWIIAADERTFVYANLNGSTGWPASNGRWYVAYFGEFQSNVVDDPYQTCVVAARHDFGQGYSPFGCYTTGGGGINASPFQVRNGIYVARNWDGVPDAQMGNYAFHAGVQPRQANQYGGQISGIFAGTNPADGKFWATHMPLCTYYGQRCVRGVLRGVMMSCAQLDYYADLSTISMASDDGLKTYLFLHTYGNTDAGEIGTTFKGNILLQTSGVVPYT